MILRLLLSPDDASGGSSSTGTANAGAGAGASAGANSDAGAANSTDAASTGDTNIDSILDHEIGSDSDSADGDDAAPTQAQQRSTTSGARGSRQSNQGQNGGDSDSTEDDASADDSDPETGSDQTAAGANTSNGITAEAIETILDRVIARAGAPTQQARGQGQQQQQQQTQQRQYTEDEYNRAFNVWQPSDELLAQLGSEDPTQRKAALKALRDGIVKQTLTLAEARMQMYRDAVYNEHIAPIQSFVSEQQARSFRDDFFKSYPDLAPYETVVEAVAAKLQTTGYQANSRQEVMKRYATDTRKVIKTLLARAKGTNSNGGGDSSAAVASGQAGKPPANGGKRMSTLTSGGQGGSSKAPAGNANARGPKGIEIFD